MLATYEILMTLIIIDIVSLTTMIAVIIVARMQKQLTTHDKLI